MYTIEVLNFSEIGDFLPMTFPFYQNKLSEGSMNGWLALGAYAEGRLPIGLALAQLEEEEGKATFCSLYVEPEYRALKVGTVLVEAMGEEISKREYPQITATYMTKSFTHLFLEKILDRCGWQSAVTKNRFLEFDSQIVTSPLFFELPSLPADYHMFPFCELTHQEQATLQRVRGELYPEELDPFLDEEEFEPLNSYGLRCGQEIVGWMVNHRVFPDTIRYTRLWVREDVRKLGLGMHLIAHSLHAQFNVREKIDKAIVVLSQKYPAMIRFAEKRLVPFSRSYYESKISIKVF